MKLNKSLQTVKSSEYWFQKFNTKPTNYLISANPVLVDNAEDLRKLYFEGAKYGTPIIGSIEAKTLEQVRDLRVLMVDSMQKSATRQETIDSIESVLGTSHSYAENVFRTVTATAYSIGKQVKQRKLENNGIIIGYEFLTAGDGRVRPAHKAMHKARVAVGNSDLNALYVPWGYQCRCSMRPISIYEAEIKGWLRNGKLIEYFPPGYNANVADYGFGQKFTGVGLFGEVRLEEENTK